MAQPEDSASTRRRALAITAVAIVAGVALCAVGGLVRSYVVPLLTGSTRHARDRVVKTVPAGAPAAAPGALVGCVLDEDDDGLAGLRVRAWTVDVPRCPDHHPRVLDVAWGRAADAETTTDADGWFALELPASRADRWVVLAEAPGRIGLAAEWEPAVGNGLTLRPPIGVETTLTVRDEFGAAVPGAALAIVPNTVFEPMHLAGTTGPDGTLALRAEERETVVASAPGFAPHGADIPDGGGPFTLVLRRGFRVAGRVVDESGAAAAGTMLHLDPGDAPDLQAVAGADGRFAFDPVAVAPEGRTLCAHLRGHAVTRLDVFAGDEDVRVQVFPPATIDGVVLLPDGTPAAGAQVAARAWEPATADAEGRFHIAAVDPGDVTLTATSGEQQVEGLDDRPPAFRGFARLQIAGGERPAGVVVRLEPVPLSYVAVRLDIDLWPGRHAQLGATHPFHAAYEKVPVVLSPGDVHTTMDGALRWLAFEAPAGAEVRFWVGRNEVDRVWASAITDATTTATPGDDAVVLPTAPCFIAPTPVAVAPPPPPHVWRTVTGRVSGPDGAPVAGAVVAVRTSDASDVRPVASPGASVRDGTFSVRVPDATDVLLSVERSGFGQALVRCAATTSVCDVVLDRDGRVRLVLPPTPAAWPGHPVKVRARVDGFDSDAALDDVESPPEGGRIVLVGRLPRGRVALHVEHGALTWNVEADVVPGETADLVLRLPR